MRKTIRLVSLLLFFVATIPGEVEAAPCGCDDIDDINDTILMVDKTRRAWYSVLSDLIGRGPASPKNGNEAKALFAKYMGWSSTKDVGGVSRTGDVKIDDDFAKAHCDGIINAVRDHENAHFWYFMSRGLVIAMSSERSIAVILARSEIDSRDVELGRLKKERAKLMKKCGRDYTTDPEPYRIQG
jgi:hypothetical protein